MFQNVPECVQNVLESIQNVQKCMQIHELACNYRSLHSVTYAYMQLHKLALSYMSLHAVHELACSSLKFHDVQWANMNSMCLHAVPFFVWAAHKNFAVLVKPQRSLKLNTWWHNILDLKSNTGELVSSVTNVMTAFMLRPGLGVPPYNIALWETLPKQADVSQPQI